MEDMTTIKAVAVSAEAFAPYGELLVTREKASKMINAGRCERHHALARVERNGGEAIISIFRSEPVSFPYECTLLERHPLGSQAFMPLGPDAWLSVVAPDENGKPGAPIGFIIPSGVGVNLHAGVWHGVLTPIDNAADFLVVDREGDGVNLEEVNIAPVIFTR